MMRTVLHTIFLAALALAIGAAGARGSGLIVQERILTGANDYQNVGLLAMAVLDDLRSRGAQVTVVPHGAMTTAGASAGQLATSAGTLQHDWVGHLAVTLVNAPGNPSVYDWRVLLNGSTWPSKPQLWYIYPVGGSGTASNAGGDSTGTSDNYPYSSLTSWGSLYFTGADLSLVWKNLYGTPKPAVTSASARSYVTSSSSGVWRPIIGWSATPASTGTRADKASIAVVNADSLRHGSVYPDSVLLWMIERFPGDPAAQVFCYAGASIVDLSTIQAAHALMDSITARTTPGGAVFTDRQRTTRYRAIGVRSGNLTGYPNLSVDLTNGGGINCPDGAVADSCDRTNVAGGRALMDALGVPYTVYEDPESLTTTRGALNHAVWAASPNVKFGMQAVSGTFSGSTTRAAAAGLCIDPFGVNRVREILPLGQTTYPPTCTADTASIYCHVANGWAALESKAPGKVDYSILPALYDWSPKQWTRGGNGGLDRDDVMAAIYANGKTRAILSNPVVTNGNVGISYSTTGGHLPNYASTPAGWELGERTLPIRWNDASIGSMKLLSVRDESSTPMWRWKQETHPGLAHEYLAGADGGKYYLIDASPYYHHTFNVATSVFMVPATSLGGPYAGPWPQRPGYWMAKSLVHGSEVANRLAPRWADGTPKILNAWVHVSDLAPRTISGLNP